MKLSERLKEERAYVEAELGDKVICVRCRCTLGQYAQRCTAELSDPCSGYLTIENCKARFALVWELSKALSAQSGDKGNGRSNADATVPSTPD